MHDSLDADFGCICSSQFFKKPPGHKPKCPYILMAAATTKGKEIDEKYA